MTASARLAIATSGFRGGSVGGIIAIESLLETDTDSSVLLTGYGGKASGLEATTLSDAEFAHFVIDGGVYSGFHTDTLTAAMFEGVKWRSAEAAQSVFYVLRKPHDYVLAAHQPTQIVIGARSHEYIIAAKAA